MTSAAVVAEWKAKNRDKVLAQHARARRRKGARPRKHDAHVRAWMLVYNPRKHDAHVAEFLRDPAREFRCRYRHDQEFRLKECLRRQLRKKAEGVPGLPERVRTALLQARTQRGRLTVEALLGYSMAQLREHLERQFVRGMSWDTYGKDGWHIDHILPKKCFDLTTMDGVCAYWALSNLRPLEAHHNLRKSANVHYLL